MLPFVVHQNGGEELGTSFRRGCAEVAHQRLVAASLALCAYCKKYRVVSLRAARGSMAAGLCGSM